MAKNDNTPPEIIFPSLCYREVWLLLILQYIKLACNSK